MKTILFRLFATIAFLAGLAHAQQPSFVPASGLQLELSTEGYKFFAGETGASTATAVSALRKRANALGGILPAADSFTAGVVLANRSRSDVNFNFADGLSAQVKFTFKVTDANGALVWQSDAGSVSTQAIVPATLGKGARWKRVLQIPLKVQGAWLKPGLYTLHAQVASVPTFAAKVGFAVAPAADLTSGISGRVLQEAPPNPLGRIAPQPVKAQLSIREIRLPNARYDHPEFSFDGTTDDLGTFKIVTPAGRFTVTATPVTLPPVNATTSTGAGATLVIAAPSATVEVSVERGVFSDVTITIPSASNLPPNTGINGTVLIGPVTPVATPGTANERPLAGALVTIDEIRQIGVFYIHPPYQWSGTASNDGTFSAPTPPGKFHVVARQPGSGPVNGPSNASSVIGSPGVADVTVADGAYSAVTLHVDSGIR